MSELKLPADSGGGSVSLKGPASTTSNADVPFVLPVADGSAGTFLKTDGSKNLSFAAAGGLSEVDQWLLTSNYSYSSGKVNIEANWARSGFAQMANGTNLGTGVTQSSGTFTLPSTGFWRIDFALMGAATASINVFETGIRIPGGNEWTQSYPSMIDGGSGTWYNSAYTSCIVDITNTSTQTVSFFVYASAAFTVEGNADQLRTGATFMKLADT